MTSTFRGPRTRWLLLALICLLPIGLLAQVAITFPANRAIFQRNQSNQATFTVAGYYSQAVDNVQARLWAVDKAGTRTSLAFDWKSIQTNPQGGAFAGTLTVGGGWYSLEVRGLLGGNPVGNVTSLDRVGVGEVFIIAGQSNAQGGYNNGDLLEDAADDRVNCVSNYFNDTFTANDPPAPVYSKITANATLAPYGKSAWCWAPLGDKLASRLNVPVLFINAAFEGTNSINWRESADGLPTEDMYKKPNKLPLGVPYVNMRLALNYYTAMLGVRAVLWHQGESDGLLNQAYEYFKSEPAPALTSGQYRDNIAHVIDKTREHSGRNLSWVIAKVSRYKACYENGQLLDRTSPTIIQGQENLITSVSNVFRGPSTDPIQVPRPSECVHFGNTPTEKGHQMHAEAWSQAMDNLFFSNSQPQSPATLPTISVGCPSAGRTLSLPGGFASYQWSTGETTQSISATKAGTYSAKVKDGLGNVFLVPAVTFAQDASASGVSVQINASGATCGGTLTLTSTLTGGSGTYTYAWSGPNGFTSSQASPTIANLSAANSGTYSLALSQNGCTVATAQTTVTITCGGTGGGGSCALTKVRLYPRAGFAYRLVGAKIQGSASQSGPWEDVLTVSAASDNTWNDYTPTNQKTYAVWRFLSPEGGYCNLSEVEFYAGASKLTGTAFGDSGGAWGGSGNTFDKALDGNTATFYDANNASGGFVGIANTSCSGGGSPPPSCTAPAAPTLVASASSVCAGQSVTLTASGCSGTVTWSTGATGSSIQVGVGSYSATCMVNACTSAASATVSIATSTNCGGGTGGGGGGGSCALTKVRLYPRAGFAYRLVGAKIQGSASQSGPWEDVLTVSAASDNTWNDYTPTNQKTYAVWRFLSPEGGYCNLSEVEFYAGASKLTGTAFGDSGGAWGGSGNTFDKALDGNTATFYDANNASGGFVGIANTSCSGGGSPPPSCTAPAAPTLVASASSVCAGQSVTLTASGCSGTVTWSTGATGSSIQVGVGSYSATCMVNACTSAASATVSIATSTNCGGGTGGGGGGGSCALTKVRLYPRAGFAYRLVGAKIQGSASQSGPWEDVLTVSAASDNTWNDYTPTNQKTYAVWRFLSPEGGYCNLSEVEFYAGASKLTGTAFGDSGGAWGGSGNTFDKALDGNTATFYDANNASGGFVGIANTSCSGGGGSGGGGTTPPPPPPSGGSGTGTGLRGTYFNNTSFAGAPVLTRTDAKIDFTWASSPASGVNDDNFSVRWEGQIEAVADGSYTFTTTSDNGIRLWINGQLVVDDWQAHTAGEKTGSITLTAGQRYDIKLEYYENSGMAIAQLDWQYAGQGRQRVPQQRLYPPAGTARRALESAENEEPREVAFDVTVAPNPSAGRVTVDAYLPQAATFSVGLYTLAGQEILHRQLTGQAGRNSVQLRFSDQPDGLYLLRVETDGQPTRLYKLLKRAD